LLTVRTGAARGSEPENRPNPLGNPSPIARYATAQINVLSRPSIHFSYGEMNQCNSDWSGGAVSAAEAKSNTLKTMWELEAMRHALGDVPVYLTDGFRSYSCNSAVGGASDSRHPYGDAADMVGSPSFCTLAQQARTHGFSMILGPGYPGHYDHAHVAADSSRYWSAPNCGI
jgi:zinc D-Ala-D-Ala carboxypeptidase